MCLLCSECVSNVTEYNLAPQHPWQLSAGFGWSPAKGWKFNGRVQAQQSGVPTLVLRSEESDSGIAWVMVAPVKDAKRVNECPLAALGEVVTDNQVRDQVMSWIKPIPVTCHGCKYIINFIRLTSGLQRCLDQHARVNPVSLFSCSFKKSSSQALSFLETRPL